MLHLHTQEDPNRREVSHSFSLAIIISLSNVVLQWYLVVGTGYVQGEDVSCKGRIHIFEIIKLGQLDNQVCFYTTTLYTIHYTTLHSH